MSLIKKQRFCQFYLLTLFCVIATSKVTEFSHLFLKHSKRVLKEVSIICIICTLLSLLDVIYMPFSVSCLGRESFFLCVYPENRTIKFLIQCQDPYLLQQNILYNSPYYFLWFILFCCINPAPQVQDGIDLICLSLVYEKNRRKIFLKSITACHKG